MQGELRAISQDPVADGSRCPDPASVLHVASTSPASLARSLEHVSATRCRIERAVTTTHIGTSAWPGAASSATPISKPMIANCCSIPSHHRLQSAFNVAHELSLTVRINGL